jgi:CheY-like chemotaxis protein
MTAQHPSSKQVLLVEDNLADVVLAREVLKEGGLPVSLHHVSDGQQAMDFLRRDGSYHEAPRPDLVLLDINMPRKNGLQTLAEIRGDPELRTLVVVILTTSNAADDIRRAYELNANAFVTKPMDLTEFADTMRRMHEFFLRSATLSGS